jgi:hypothetical protein
MNGQLYGTLKKIRKGKGINNEREKMRKMSRNNRKEMTKIGGKGRKNKRTGR